MARDSAKSAEVASSHSPLAEMLSREPSTITRRFLYFILLLLSSGLLAAAIIRVDVTITAPATLRPQDKTIHIQSEMAGRARIQVREGQNVTRGQTLILLESREAGEDLFELRKKAQNLQAILRERKTTLPVELEKIQNEIASLGRETRYLEQMEQKKQKRRELLQQQLNGLDKTYRQELLAQDEKDKQARADLEKAQSSYQFWTEELRSQLALRRRKVASEIEVRAARRSMEEALSELTKARSIHQQGAIDRRLIDLRYHNDHRQRTGDFIKAEEELKNLQKEKEANERKIASLHSESHLKRLEIEKKELLARFEQAQARRQALLPREDLSEAELNAIANGKDPVIRRVQLKAPVDGKIGPVLIGQQGETVTPGQSLLRLIPNGPLIAEVRIANRDIGLVKPGQRVKLKLEAFPYTEHGVIEGEVRTVPPESETEEGSHESFYRALVSLKTQSVTKEGLQIPLLSGMTGTAEVVTERKTVLQLILSPFTGSGR